MKRTILFRGKTKQGEWVYGLPFYNNGIIDGIESKDGKLYYVVPETVGQFTDLTDKNSIKIFEGDIVVSRYPNGNICSIGDIQFACGVFGVEWTHHKKYKTMVGGFGQLHNLRRLDDDFIGMIEVIGNIHDNPELLEVEE